MKTYISPDIKTLIMNHFMQNIYDVVSNAKQLGNEGNFDEEENSPTVVSYNVWED